MPARNLSGAKRTGLDPGTDTPSGPRHGRPDPLDTGWVILTVAIGVMAALIAIGGMVLSFRAVSTEMIPSFGAQWAWLVPIVVDLTVFVFSGVDLVLARLDMSHPLARWTVYGATGGTVWLNYSAGTDSAARVAHVLMPAVWVVFVELMRHVVRRQVLIATDNHREPVPAARWLLAPYSTLKLWRRMVLWRVHSYPAAIAQERVRLHRIAKVRSEHGRLWRWRVSALDRLSIGLAEPETPDTGRILAAVQTDTAPSASGQVGRTPAADRTGHRPDTGAEQRQRETDSATGQNRTTVKSANGQGSAPKRRATDAELMAACQIYAVETGTPAADLTRAQIKEAADNAGYTISNDRVTKIALSLDSVAA